jgi:hypothetical protein
VLQVGEVVSPPTPIFAYLSQDSHNEIYNIYDKYIHLQPPFESFFGTESMRGIEDLVYGKVGETN